MHQDSESCGRAQDKTDKRSCSGHERAVTPGERIPQIQEIEAAKPDTVVLSKVFITPASAWEIASAQSCGTNRRGKTSRDLRVNSSLLILSRVTLSARNLVTLPRRPRLRRRRHFVPLHPVVVARNSLNRGRGFRPRLRSRLRRGSYRLRRFCCRLRLSRTSRLLAALLGIQYHHSRVNRRDVEGLDRWGGEWRGHRDSYKDRRRGRDRRGFGRPRARVGARCLFRKARRDRGRSFARHPGDQRHHARAAHAKHGTRGGGRSHRYRRQSPCERRFRECIFRTPGKPCRIYLAGVRGESGERRACIEEQLRQAAGLRGAPDRRPPFFAWRKRSPGRHSRRPHPVHLTGSESRVLGRDPQPSQPLSAMRPPSMVVRQPTPGLGGNPGVTQTLVPQPLPIAKRGPVFDSRRPPGSAILGRLNPRAHSLQIRHAI